MSKKYDNLFSEEEKDEMRHEYLCGASIRDLQKKYQISSKEWIQRKLLKGITRGYSEANTVSHQKHPERFRHSEVSKEKIRQARLKFMKEHPEQTAWRKNNEPSYPESCFIKFLKENAYDKKYLVIREEPVFPFYIDFAFYPIKLAVEIDGSQHIRDEKRKARDEEKDSLLKSKGWKVLRVAESLVKTDWHTLKAALDDILEKSPTEDVVRVGIFNREGTSNKYVPVQRGEDGLSDKQRDSQYKSRKVKNRPSLSEINELRKKHTMIYIGRLYGVSDSAVRKWIKLYEKRGDTPGEYDEQ